MSGGRNKIVGGGAETILELPTELCMLRPFAQYSQEMSKTSFSFQ